MDAGNLIGDVIRAARDFHSRKLWERFTNYDCFAVRLPGCEETLLASVMGDAGEQYGLMLFRGPHAFDSFAALANPDGPGDDAAEGMDMLSLRMETFGEIDLKIQDFYRQEGVHPKFDEEVPDFLVKPANRQPRLPNREDLTLLLHVIRAAVVADRRKLLKPAELDDAEGICVLSVEGDPARPDVSVTRESPPPSRSQSHGSAASDMDLSGLPRLDGTWWVATPVIPIGIDGDGRSLQMLLAVDRTSGRVVQAKPFFAGEIGEAAEALVEAFGRPMPGSPGGVPDKIIFSNRKLCDAMAAALQREAVACTYEARIPELQEIMADFLDHVRASTPMAGSLSEEVDAGDIPTADDLVGWKEVDRRLTKRFADFLRDEDRLWSSRAVKRYFGDDDLDYYLDEYQQLGVIAAYATWGVVAYRATRNSKTQAEKMLAQGLPEAEAMLLRARMEGYPSIYRVARHDAREGTVDLEDVLLGGDITVYDQLLSENIDNNVFLVFRAFAAGKFHLIDASGPPLSFGMVAEAVEFLQDLGLDLTPEALASKAHLFGRLWDWTDQWQADRPLPVLCNMDGDDMVFHTASFSVADEANAREALSRRKDIEFDEYSDEFVWMRAAGKAAETLGGPVLLGRIEFIADELLLTTNSAPRFDEAHTWLAKLPGVTFCGVETRSAEEALKDRRPDETISPPEPVEFAPEMAAGVQEMIDRQYMNWIDTPLPALGGKTPRQACRTAAGRQEVTTLIRTIPDPTGNASVTVPRAAMLQKLGLEAPPQASRIPASRSPEGNCEPEPPVRSPLQADARIGRNDPCPCQSGKKYKKCCGG